MATVMQGGGVPPHAKTFLGHPRGLYLLFFAELWERFSYYGMRAILVFYLTKHLLFTEQPAYAVYGAYTSMVYITPILGGWIADRYLGARKAVLAGGVLITIGHLLIALVDRLHDARPLHAPERILFGGAQPVGGTGQHEHADAAPHLDIAVVLKPLIRLGDGQRVGAVFGREGTDGGQLVPRPVHAAQDAGRDRAAQAEIDRAVLVAQRCHALVVHHRSRMSTHQ